MLGEKSSLLGLSINQDGLKIEKALADLTRRRKLKKKRKIGFHLPSEIRWDGFFKSPWKGWISILSISGSKTPVMQEALVNSLQLVLKLVSSMNLTAPLYCVIMMAASEKSRRLEVVCLPGFREPQPLVLLKHLQLDLCFLVKDTHANLVGESTEEIIDWSAPKQVWLRLNEIQEDPPPHHYSLILNSPIAHKIASFLNK